jgi:hypothetical protein
MNPGSGSLVDGSRSEACSLIVPENRTAGVLPQAPVVFLFTKMPELPASRSACGERFRYDVLVSATDEGSKAANPVI